MPIIRWGIVNGFPEWNSVDQFSTSFRIVPNFSDSRNFIYYFNKHYFGDQLNFKTDKSIMLYYLTQNSLCFINLQF